MILLLFVYLHFFTDVLFSCFFLFAYFFFSSTECFLVKCALAR